MAAASTNGLIFVGDRVDIWVGRYENREGRMIGNAPLPGIGTLAVKMHRGELLIGCSQGIGGLSNGKLWSAGKPEGAARDYRYNCQAILPLRDGRIAVGGRCGTVALVDRQARMTRTLHTGLGVNVWVSDFAIDEKGRLWIAMCGSGVWVFDGERLVSYGPKHEWVPSERVYAVAFDAEGALWVGSGSNGVARRLPDGSTELFDQNNGPIAQGAYGIWLDDEERVWVARSHDGLVVWSNGRWKYPVFENCSFTVGKAMPTDAGRWWVSSSARLALTGPPEWHDEPPGNEYTHERIAAEWPGPFPERVKSVVDGSGRTYVRCDDGVWRFDGETWEPLQEVLKASATVLHVDRRKRVWIGTVLQGLVRFDEHGTAVFLRDPGKMKSRIDAVADADVGGVFVGTGYGIWHIPEGGNEAVIIKDGMSVPWIVRDADGRQYCASTYFGAYLLDGKKAVRAEPKAGHALIDFYVNDKGQAEGLSSETTAKGVEAVRFVLDGTEVHVVEGPEPTAAE
jgi:ligand-binding sensor domain-containing protein